MPNANGRLAAAKRQWPDRFFRFRGGTRRLEQIQCPGAGKAIAPGPMPGNARFDGETASVWRGRCPSGFAQVPASRFEERSASHPRMTGEAERNQVAVCSFACSLSRHLPFHSRYGTGRTVLFNLPRAGAMNRCSNSGATGPLYPAAVRIIVHGRKRARERRGHQRQGWLTEPGFPIAKPSQLLRRRACLARISAAVAD